MEVLYVGSLVEFVIVAIFLSWRSFYGKCGALFIY